MSCSNQAGKPFWFRMSVPHFDGVDDFAFLATVTESASKEAKHQIRVLPEGLNASEIKWIISQCSAFIGARTHSTIAALSSSVPTISLGYSLKAKGINEDIFGN